MAGCTKTRAKRRTEAEATSHAGKRIIFIAVKPPPRSGAYFRKMKHDNLYYAIVDDLYIAKRIAAFLTLHNIHGIIRIYTPNKYLNHPS